MARVRSQDTVPELIVRRWLWSRGYRYRKNVRGLPGTPDIVLRKYGVIIFVHGCFWHGHTAHMRLPYSNPQYWQDKIARNRFRDARQKEALRRQGWSVITVWECQLVPSKRRRTLAAIEFFINRSYLEKHQDQPAVKEYAQSEAEPSAGVAAEKEADYPPTVK